MYVLFRVSVSIPNLAYFGWIAKEWTLFADY